MKMALQGRRCSSAFVKGMASSSSRRALGSQVERVGWALVVISPLYEARSALEVSKYYLAAVDLGSE